MIDISLTQLQHFVALADTGSFTKGATRVHRSQAAFSRSIAMLEEQVGARLIDRIGHSNELTPFGRIILQHARNVIADIDTLTRTAEEHANGIGGHFRLGLGSTPRAILSVPLLAYVSNHPKNLRITLTSGPTETQLQALRAQQVDALIVEARSVSPTPDLLIEHVADLKTGLLCRPDHPLARRKAFRFRDLLDYPVASTSISDEAARFLVERYGPEAHPDQFISLQCDEVTSLLKVAQTTTAVFMGVIATARDLVRDGKLVRIQTSDISIISKFSIITLRGRTMPASIPVIRTIIDEMLSDGPETAGH
ncbi:LysR family transcriptional regulator (plasmid) [Sphingopyxis fribergensis]|uniref:LysR family transcriptional regulator n=1 Tax=Sphingopyxis fribergensis TaxID=1515612 RepID=A0A0A7PNU6_9SPHN|nr:LysR family transcriptional regulator [Sphingopyxis fribergensis]AJA11756.1 LysR family transcriptional regulator [Sphingopyxis fribergensis]